MLFFSKVWKAQNRQSQRRKPSSPSCVLLPVLLIQFVICRSRAEGLTTTVNLIIPYCKMSWCLTGEKLTAQHRDTDHCSGTRTLVSVVESKFISCTSWSSVFDGFGVDVQEMNEAVFWDQNRTPLCRFCDVLYSYIKLFLHPLEKTKKLKR